MSDPRLEVLSAIARNKLAGGERRGPADASQRLASLSRAESLALFEEMAVSSAATVGHAGDLQALPAAAGRYLHKRGCDPGRPVYLNNPALAALDWRGLNEAAPEAVLSVSSDKTYFDSPVCVTGAFCGIAETGTVVLVSGPDVSSAAWFLADTLIVAVDEETVVPMQEAVWTRLGGGHRGVARTVTLVTGPSRTGDIEQKLVIGAHGPRSVHLVLYRG